MSTSLGKLAAGNGQLEEKLQWNELWMQIPDFRQLSFQLLMQINFAINNFASHSRFHQIICSAFFCSSSFAFPSTPNRQTVQSLSDHYLVQHYVHHLTPICLLVVDSCGNTKSIHVWIRVALLRNKKSSFRKRSENNFIFFECEVAKCIQTVVWCG